MPTLASAAVSPCFQDLVQSIPELHDDDDRPIASEFDWALHPGGSLIITGVEQAMNLTPEHLRASYEIYMKYGNSSSATIISVLNKLRESEGKEHVVACAFGPGIALEMMILRRRKETSLAANGVEQKDAISVSDQDGESLPNGAANGSGVSHANGDAITIDDSTMENGHPARKDIAADAVFSDAGQAVLNGGSTVKDTAYTNGEHRSTSNLPIEDLD